ncbi:hypothetical protein Tco_1151225, partial [Tanacetum coccineum]
MCDADEGNAIVLYKADVAIIMLPDKPGPTPSHVAATKRTIKNKNDVVEGRIGTGWDWIIKDHSNNEVIGRAT